jgi:hypothetical protein
MPRMRILVAALLIALALPMAAQAAPAAHCTKGKCAKKRATKLFADRVFIKFTETGSIGNPSSLDQRLHLCAGGNYIYDSWSYIEETGTSSLQRYTGTWRVRKARMSRNGKRGSARVRGKPDGGGPATTVKITWTRSAARLDGAEVIVQQSDLC